MSPSSLSVRFRTAAVAVSTTLMALCQAAPLKVDISNSGRPLAEGLDPAFTDWATTQNWFTGGNSTSRNFSGVTVTFTRTGSVGTALQTGYWKTGVQSTAYNVKLTADGLKVADGDTGAQIEMRIAGLTAGPHTILLYLNNWDAITSNAPLDILVNGTQVVNDLAVSTQVTDNNNATTAYLNVTAVAGQDMVVLIKAETSGSQTSKNVHINGFEIDTPNAKAQANNPVPAHADEHVDADTGSKTLSWTTAVLGAASHDVYFGLSESAVANATTASPEFKGNQTTNTYPVTGLNVHLTYYWRVDEVASNGTVTKGNVWYFRPRRLAFPGAEGYGRFARGGRGGVVREVTNLNDSGAGSLRDAIEGDYGPRTVVFTVSGLITLNDDIIIGGTRPYITIAGQTAPGKGICVKRQQLAISGADDVIFRFMRGLVGKESGETQNATGMAGANHCIMDHCTFGWGIDEGLSTRGGKNLTFQRCNLSEALNVAGHQNYPAGTAHGYAASIGGDIGSFHHNLLAHNEGRNWSMAGGLDAAGYYAGKLDLFNNLVYNWRGRTTDGGAHQVNFVNNYYKPGAATTLFTALNPDYGGFPGTQQYYMSGNVMLGKFNESNQAAGLDIGTENGGTLPENSTPPYTAMVGAPFFPSHATIHTATNAYKQVLSNVGCNQPMIDNHDTRLITETLNGTYTYTGSVSGKKGLPDTTNDVGGWENYGTAARPGTWDTDQDGIPNWWEALQGLNTSSAAGDFSESNADPDGNGYTNLEEYLNWLAAPNADCATTVDVDLAKLSRGYISSPVYVLSGTVNGTVSIVNTNKARFTATNPNSAALGAFTFTVTDSAGDTMTQTIGVRILGPGGISAQAVPTGLAPTVSGTQVTLNWTASPGATSYKVKRSSISGDSFPVTIASPAGTSHVDTGLANGTYHYIVSAIGTGGESGDSGQVSATITAGTPVAPTGLTATAGNTQVSLSWSAVSGATSYNVKRATTNGGPYTTVSSPTGTSYVNTGLTNGTTYYYVVSAVNGTGESANSSQVNATPQTPAPSAPTGLSATGGNTQVSLSWTAVSGATSYNVKRGTANGGPYTTVASPTGTTYVNTGLTNGTPYYYVVSAVGTGGESINSTQTSATPAAAGTSTTIQAESGAAGGGTAFEQGSSGNSGFNGTGYANFPTSGGTLQFNNLSGGTGGTATLAIRFTVGGSTSRTGNLVVNGVSQSITFPATTLWNNWTILTVSIPLTSGTTNTLRFDSTGQDLANLDELTITPAAIVLPTVTIVATDGTAGEFGGDQSVGFTITRTGATTAALSVPLVASGTATGGSDYSGFASSVSIPIGQASVALPLTVLPDALSEGSETVTIALGASAAFTAGSPASASATIADNPSQSYFFTAIANPAKRGPNDDADGDSSANIVEYFMGSNPDNAGSQSVLTIPSVGEGTFKVRYLRAKNRPDVSGNLRWSSNLGSWFSNGQVDGIRTVTFTEAVVSAPAADPETVEATGTITGSGEGQQIFVRLGVQ
ncbi:MAG: fibronectin type III domain-containing protein [Verrucomicrobiota bacterium]